MKYRAELDGLRFIAVVPVVLYHADLELLSGGFLGVDVFFVISGYLIGSLLYEETQKGHFSVINFYDRRIRRIIPPLIVTAFLTIFISSSFTPSDIKNVGQSLVATFLFISNYFFYLETDYFNQFNQSAPLLHTWSLSVEEQYYLFIPFIIYFVSKFKRAKYFLTLTLLVISFYFAVQLTSVNANLSFYSVHTRAWELLVGTLLAFLSVDFDDYRPGEIVSEILSSFAIVILISSFFIFDKHMRHPSYATIVPVLATSVVIYYSKSTKILIKFLTNRVAVFIGLISYSFYLFHNPIFSAVEYHFSANMKILKLASIPFVVLLSFASYRFVEQPLRRTSKNLKFVYILIFICVSTLMSIGYLTHKSNGFLQYFRNNFPINPSLMINVESERKLIEEQRLLHYPSDLDFSCLLSKCVNVLIIGDSFSDDAYLSMSYLKESNYSVRRVNYDDECMKNFDPVLLYQECFGNKIKFDLLNYADVILISAKWQETTYIHGYHFADQLAEKFDAKVFLVGSVMFEDLNSFAFRLDDIADNATKIAELAYSSQRFDRLRVSDRLRALVDSAKEIEWIERSDYFCKQSSKMCRLYDDNFNPLIWDNAHLTTRAYSSYGNYLLEHIGRTLNEY